MLRFTAAALAMAAVVSLLSAQLWQNLFTTEHDAWSGFAIGVVLIAQRGVFRR